MKIRREKNEKEKESENREKKKKSYVINLGLNRNSLWIQTLEENIKMGLEVMMVWKRKRRKPKKEKKAID